MRSLSIANEEGEKGSTRVLFVVLWSWLIGSSSPAASRLFVEVAIERSGGGGVITIEEGFAKDE